MAAEVTPVTARPPVRSQVSPPARRRRSLRRKATSWLRGAIIVIVCVVALFPVYWMVLTTFQPAQDSITYPPDLLPHGIQFGTITSLFANNPIASWLLHSLTASAICVAVTLIFAVPGAYLLSRLRWHGVGGFGFLLLFTQLMPGAMIVVPELQFFRQLGISTFITEQTIKLDQLEAAGVVFALLPILLYLTVQRHVVRGLTAGAIKG